MIDNMIRNTISNMIDKMIYDMIDNKSHAMTYVYIYDVYRI